jgi:hypothetical protein
MHHNISCWNHRCVNPNNDVGRKHVCHSAYHCEGIRVKYCFLMSSEFFGFIMVHTMYF